jgi:uncharacterized phage-associated protein
MEPLFIDEIEAWDYGPVVNSVYQKYKVCGREPIKAVDEDYSHDAFSEKELDTLITTMQEYGKYTAFTLLKLTHNDGPWKQAYYSNSRITKENLLEYFADIAEKIKSPLEQIIERSELVKEFPKEWYDSSEDAIWKPSHA